MDGWSDRDGRGTDRRAYPPEPRWRRSRVDKRHMARGTCRREKACKKLLTPLQVKRGDHRAQTRKAHAYYPNLCAFGVAVPVGCQLHAPGAKKFFDVGSSGLKKL